MKKCVMTRGAPRVPLIAITVSGGTVTTGAILVLPVLRSSQAPPPQDAAIEPG